MTVVPAETLDDLQHRLDDLLCQLRAQGDLAALGVLSAALAHEFNNVLTPAVGHAQIGLNALSAATPTPADLEVARRSLGRCRDAANRAGRLSAAVLDLARPTPAEQIAADVAQAVSAAVETLGDVAGDGIELQVAVPPHLRVAGEPAAVESAVLNLLLNARRALLNVPIDRRRLTVAAEPAAANVALRVADTGPGVDPDVLPRLFEPFATGPGGGSGLGLHLCRRLAERRGGTLAVDTRTGVGTAFTLVLPRAA